MSNSATSPLPDAIERVATSIVDCSLHVHRQLGPGLLESVYETCLAYEIGKRGMKVDRQVQVPLYYDGVRLENELRLDFLVEGSVIVELKAVEALLPVHQAQLLTYLRLANKPLGFLINFNVPLIKQGIQRMRL
jgi:GxxExxY protein